MIDTNESIYAMVVTLLEQEIIQNEKTFETISFWSKNLTENEHQYSATEIQCLQVAWGIPSLRPYVEKTKFIVKSYQDELRWIMSFGDPHRRLDLWRLIISALDFTIQYRPQFKNQVPEAFYRCVDEMPASEGEGDQLPCFGDDSVLIPTRNMAHSSKEDEFHEEELEEEVAFDES